MRWFVLLPMVLLLGCAIHPHKVEKRPAETSAVYTFWQIGEEIFVPRNGGEDLDFAGAREVESGPLGWRIQPQKRCVRLAGSQGTARICLKRIPLARPRLYLLRSESTQAELKITSLFEKFALFRWQEGHTPDLSKGRLIKGHLVKDTDLSPDTAYYYAVAVYFGERLLGPLSEPVKVTTIDDRAPEPPSGGGYLIDGQDLILLWEESPSPDVAFYWVERDGRRLKRVSKAPYVDHDWHLGAVYDVKAVDRAGNASRPLIIKVSRGTR